MEQTVATNKYKDKIVTIPNILSLFRIILIPFIVWSYLGRENHTLAGILVLVSAFTDILDGFIARRFNMISDVGKVLDPIADKATQAVVALLLSITYPLMLIPVGLGVIKEIFMTITGYMIIKKCNIVLGANWYGKLATVLLTAAMALHLFWSNLNPILSTVSTIIASLSILLAIVLYAVRNFKYLLGKMDK